MADELAERGRPVAGIDPKKPNQQQRIFGTLRRHTRAALMLTALSSTC